VTALLALLDERASLLAFKKFLKLMRCQSGFFVLSLFRGNLQILRRSSDLKPSVFVCSFLVFAGEAALLGGSVGETCVSLYLFRLNALSGSPRGVPGNPTY
jgi:hypothetical protein